MGAAKVKIGEIVAAVAAGLLFIVMFLNWYGVDESGFFALDDDQQVDLVKFAPDEINVDRLDISAWQAFSFIDLILLLTIVIAIGTAVMSAASRSPNLPVAASAITTCFGILATLLILIRLIATPYGLDRDPFAFVGLILAGAIAVGGWMAMGEEGISLKSEADRIGAGRDEPPPGD